MENVFKIRAYGRTELAQAYFPKMTSNGAWKKLRGWIAGCHGLTERLSAIGYDPKRRSFTPAEVRAIVEFLDEP